MFEGNGSEAVVGRKSGVEHGELSLPDSESRTQTHNPLMHTYPRFTSVVCTRESCCAVTRGYTTNHSLIHNSHPEIVFPTSSFAHGHYYFKS